MKVFLKWSNKAVKEIVRNHKEIKQDLTGLEI